MKIETTNYMSTNDFVHENKLQEKAEELFGKNWEAEFDVEQIEELLDNVAPNKYMVTCYGAMFTSDYAIEVRELDCTTNYCTEELKKELERRGYFTYNLWTTDDVRVRTNFEIEEDKAQHILKQALMCEYIIQEVWDSIDRKLIDNKNILSVVTQKIN
tara:strand:- start:123 stop:596 length:474 start_codon:yes stop_codon:yes gene_type:complete